MTSVLISSPSRMDNVFQGRAMPTTMPPQQWHGVSPQQQQQAQVKPTCGSRSRLLSLPIQSNDVIPSGYPCAEHQHAVTSSHQSYEAALRRQLLAASSSSSSTSSSFDDVNTSPGPIDVYQIAQALAHFGITPAAASTDCRPKAPLERSISMPVDATSPTSLKHLQLQQQQLQPQPPVNASRYKTEMCRPFEEHGFCKYGDKCQFAHGVQELRTVNRHPKYKTELCRTFHTVGFCAYGSRCHFVHNEEERAAAGPGPQQRASPPLPIMSKATSPAYQMPAGGNASGYGRHLPVVRCGSLGSTTDSSPPPSPVDLQSSSSVFFNNTSPSYVMTPSPVSPSTPSVLTLNDLSALIAGLRAGGVSPPSPTESMTYGSDGCYDVMSLSSSSAESSPTKCMPPSAFSAAAVGRIPNFSYYN